MAIPLVYKSALSVPSLEASVRDLAEYQRRMKDQNEEKIAFDLKQEQIKADKIANGEIKEEDWKPEVMEWE